MKTCRQCKIEKPFEAFYRCKKNNDGYRNSCIECEKLRKLELKKNPLMQLERQIRSSIMMENKLLKRENKKLCYSCKEIFLIDDLVGGVYCKGCTTEHRKEYRENNKEKINEHIREYYENNRDKILKKVKEYRIKNKEKIKEKNKEYYEKKKLERLENESM